MRRIKKREPFFIPAVYIIVTDSDGKLLMLKRKNTGYYDGYLTLPSGHVERHEGIIDAAIRELREETGIITQKNKCVVAHMMRRRINTLHSYVDFYVTVKTFTGSAINAEPQKSSLVAWIPQKILPKNTIPHVRKAIHFISCGTLVSELDS